MGLARYLCILKTNNRTIRHWKTLYRSLLKNFFNGTDITRLFLQCKAETGSQILGLIAIMDSKFQPAGSQSQVSYWRIKKCAPVLKNRSFKHFYNFKISLFHQSRTLLHPLRKNINAWFFESSISANTGNKSSQSQTVE